MDPEEQQRSVVAHRVHQIRVMKREKTSRPRSNYRRKIAAQTARFELEDRQLWTKFLAILILSNLNLNVLVWSSGWWQSLQHSQQHAVRAADDIVLQKARHLRSFSNVHQHLVGKRRQSARKHSSMRQGQACSSVWKEQRRGHLLSTEKWKRRLRCK